MSLASQIAAVVAAIGADVKSVYSRLAALEDAVFGTLLYLRCTKTTDTLVTATSPVNVPEMGVTLLPNAIYRFTYAVVYRASKTTTGIALAVTGPSGYRALAYQKVTPTSVAAAAISTANTYSTDQPSASTPTANQDYFATLEGVIATGTAGGAFTLQAASKNNDAVTVRLGTNGVIERVA